MFLIKRINRFFLNMYFQRLFRQFFSAFTLLLIRCIQMQIALCSMTHLKIALHCLHLPSVSSLSVMCQCFEAMAKQEFAESHKIIKTAYSCLSMQK